MKREKTMMATTIALSPSPPPPPLFRLDLYLAFIDDLIDKAIGSGGGSARSFSTPPGIPGEIKKKKKRQAEHASTLELGLIQLKPSGSRPSRRKVELQREGGPVECNHQNGSTGHLYALPTYLAKIITTPSKILC
ncbi:hypothetical protein ACMFMF_003787 [Clarireedia jacksonii]